MSLSKKNNKLVVGRIDRTYNEMQLLLKNVDTGNNIMQYNINSSNSILTDSSGVTYALAPQSILALELV